MTELPWLPWIVGLSIVAVVCGLAARYDARRRARSLAALADRVGGELTSSSSIGGQRNGVTTTLRFGVRREESDHKPWTEIWTRLPAGYPLEIHMRPRCGSDLQRSPPPSTYLDDLAFDIAYFVEAAPRDVVREMIDEPMRAVLMSYRGELTTIDDGRGGRLLQLAVPSWIECELPLAELVDALVRVTQRVRLAYATDERFQPIAGAPYREQVEGTRLAALEAARAIEVANLVDRRATRDNRERRYRLIVLGGFVSWGILISVLDAVL